MDSPRHTCLKLEVPISGAATTTEPIFVRGTWYPTHFQLSITNGLQTWCCNPSEEEVKERASQWDQSVSDYIDLAEKHLGFQQPGSVYGFSDAGNGNRRLSWTFEKEGTKLEWRWKCQPSADNQKTTAEILDFLLDANIRLSEEVVRKTQSFDRLKVEAEKCLAQSERLSNEKAEFETEIYAKFAAVLNSKKAKLRELRDRLSKQEKTPKFAEDDEEQSTDATESYDGSDEVKSEAEPGMDKNLAGTSKGAPSTKSRRRKRT